jgi:hypothetical protein
MSGGFVVEIGFVVVVVVVVVSPLVLVGWISLYGCAASGAVLAGLIMM